MLIYLERAVAKDRGEDWRREHGDDGQQDCNAGCDEKRQMAMVILSTIWHVLGNSIKAFQCRCYTAQCAFWVVRWPCGQKLKSENTLSDGKKIFLRLFLSDPSPIVGNACQ